MKMFLQLFVMIILILLFWSVVIEPNLLQVKTIRLKNQQLKGLRVVFASDFHIKPYEIFRLKKIVSEINNQKPDIILLGGDYVNGHSSDFTMSPKVIAKNLGNLKSNYGTIAVMGNHDGWQGKFNIIKAFRENNISVLENSNIEFDRFTVAGVEDMQTANPDVNSAILGAKNPIILLSHTPDIYPETRDKAFLTLAGHLHGGQIVLPFVKNFYIPSKYGKRYLYGLKTEGRGYLYTTRGLGTSILPVRFNCVPEIVVFQFE